MTTVGEIVARAAGAALEANTGLLTRLVTTRARFENWLHLEILGRLLSELDGYDLEAERRYPGTRERCDLWLRSPDGDETWIELKCCVTNYCSAFTTKSSARPITNEISEILRDKDKLARIEQGTLEILLIAYPMPDGYTTHVAWSGHLAKFKAAELYVVEAFSIPLSREAYTAAVVGYRLALDKAGPNKALERPRGAAV